MIRIIPSSQCIISAEIPEKMWRSILAHPSQRFQGKKRDFLGFFRHCYFTSIRQEEMERRQVNPVSFLRYVCNIRVTSCFLCMQNTCAMVKRKKVMEMFYSKQFWKATGVRCLRTFFSSILGVWTAGTLVTDVDWKTVLLASASSTIYIFITCLIAGLPEVEEVEE